MGIDATGRTDSKRRIGRKGRGKITGQFAPRLVEMLESPAYRTLTLSAHRILSRLEVELGHHAGKGNGSLICTHDDFERYGVHRNGIGPAIRECVALGFVEVTVQGQGGDVGEFRTPSRYRLTWRHTDYDNPTDEWRQIMSEDQAIAKVKVARNRKSSRAKRTKTGLGNRTKEGFSPVVETTNP